MNMPEVPNDSPVVAGDMQFIAAQLASSFAQMTRLYREHFDLSSQEADNRARGLDSSAEEFADDVSRVRDRPPDQVDWFSLSRLVERDPELILEVWSDLREDARLELESGHRTAEALEWKGSPWARARFLALRDSFRQDLQPKSGIESALVDSATEAYADYLEWTEHFHMLSGSEVELARHKIERDSRWSPARLTRAQSIEQASKLAERAHQRFLRTIKTLHELQRVSSTFYVAQAGQINMGAQQINVSQLSQHGSHDDSAETPNDFDKSAGGD